MFLGAILSDAHTEAKADADWDKENKPPARDEKELEVDKESEAHQENDGRPVFEIQEARSRWMNTVLR